MIGADMGIEVEEGIDYVIEDSAETRPGHDAHYGLDGTKLASLGWTSPMSLADSMKNVVQWYEQNPQWLLSKI